MVRVKMLRGNETAIIDSGKSYMFDIGGRCTAEDAGSLMSYMDGACDLPIISVLSSGTYCEVGVVTPGQEQLKRYTSNMSQMEIAMNLQAARGYIKMLRRSGTQAGVRFNQMLFVYREDFALSSVLSRLQLTEV